MLQFDFSKSGGDSSRISNLPPFTPEPFPLELPENFWVKVKEVQSRFDTLLVLGIGGSSQGLKAILNAIPATKMRVFVQESTDPRSVRHLSETLDWKKTCLVVISKSGTTIETLTLFDFFRKKVKPEQIITIMDQKPGEWFHFPFPKIDGRFSVLSVVGLFPAACGGVAIEKIQSGGQKAFANPANAYQQAFTHYFHNKEQHRNIAVFFHYADGLHELGNWAVQLLGESLGKDGKGMTPMVVQGPQGQHSIAQLILDGPKDKVVTFLKVAAQKNDLLEALLEKECSATAQALHESGCPSVTITLPTLDEESLGELFMTFQLQTLFQAHLMDVEPFGQPAVEKIKRLIG